jgi:hypothetical protein
MNKNTVRNKVSSHTSIRKRKDIIKYFLGLESKGKRTAVKLNTFWSLRLSRKKKLRKLSEGKKKDCYGTVIVLVHRYGHTKKLTPTQDLPQHEKHNSNFTLQMEEPHG